MRGAGCGAPASVTLRFQPTERQAWLVELDEHAARTQGDLCNRHAAALVLPRGWELHDERAMSGPTPLVAAAADEAVASPNGNGKVVRRVARRKTPAEAAPEASRLPGLDPAPAGRTAAAVEAAALEGAPVAEEVPVVEEVALVEEVGEEAAVTQEQAAEGDVVAGGSVAVQFGTTEDDDVEQALGEILDARTPLLQRAFRNAKPL